MKIAVTGSTGQLGSLVIEKLKQAVSKDNIVALARNIEKAKSLDVEVRPFDYASANLEESLKGIDKLLLISGSEVGKRIEQHKNIINAAVKAGVGFIAYTSLLKVDSSSLVLAPEHKETEKMIKDSGIPYVFLRHGWYTENYMGSLDQVVASKILIGASGDGKISSASREDYAEADVKVLVTEGHEGKIYELAGDESFTMGDMAKEIGKQSDTTVQYQNLSVEEFTKALIQSGMPEGGAAFFAGTHVSTEKGDLFDDNKVLSKLIGRPTTPLSKVISNALK